MARNTAEPPSCMVSAEAVTSWRCGEHVVLHHIGRDLQKPSAPTPAQAGAPRAACPGCVQGAFEDVQEASLSNLCSFTPSPTQQRAQREPLCFSLCPLPLGTAELCINTDL